MRKQPTDIDEYEAHLEVFGPDKSYQTPGFKRIAVLIQIINNAESLRSSAFLHQRAIEERVAFTVMGRRMGVPASHPAVRMVGARWTVVFANTFAGLGTPGHHPLEPRVLCDRIRAQYELFCRTWLP